MTNMIKQSVKISIGLSLFFIYAISVAGWALAAEPVEATVSLKSDQTITDSYIRLHDVFDGVGANGEHVLAPAPAAGDELVLGLHDLTRISNAFDLHWSPKSADPKITLRQDAQLVTPVMIKSALETSNLRDKVGSHFRISLENPTQTLTLKGRDVVNLDIDDVSYDPITERFSATLSAVRDGQRLDSLRLQGTAAKLVSVPVLAARLRNGDIIKAQHLAYVDMLNRDISTNMVIKADEIIGMTPRRALNTDQVILSSDLVAPMLIKKNDMINVTFKNGPIELSTKGRAMTQGAKGEIVQILNPSSKKIIEAIVTGPQQAVVSNLNPING